MVFNYHIARALYLNNLIILFYFISGITRKSCKDILARNKFAVSGTYWIKPAAGKSFQVYCDMETHGGDWTLVYSYTFTNYTVLARQAMP